MFRFNSLPNVPKMRDTESQHLLPSSLNCNVQPSACVKFYHSTTKEKFIFIMCNYKDPFTLFSFHIYLSIFFFMDDICSKIVVPGQSFHVLFPKFVILAFLPFNNKCKIHPHYLLLQGPSYIIPFHIFLSIYFWWMTDVLKTAVCRRSFVLF
jgi:hypothetical protein